MACTWVHVLPLGLAPSGVRLQQIRAASSVSHCQVCSSASVVMSVTTHAYVLGSVLSLRPPEGTIQHTSGASRAISDQRQGGF